jgi:hypothetical protein
VRIQGGIEGSISEGNPVACGDVSFDHDAKVNAYMLDMRQFDGLVDSWYLRYIIHYEAVTGALWVHPRCWFHPEVTSDDAVQA